MRKIAANRNYELMKSARTPCSCAPEIESLGQKLNVIIQMIASLPDVDQEVRDVIQEIGINNFRGSMERLNRVINAPADK